MLLEILCINFKYQLFIHKIENNENEHKNFAFSKQ